MTSLLDNLDCSSDGEDINRLFPKCRSGGKSLGGGPDVNLNTLHDDCNDNRVLSLVMSSCGDANGGGADDLMSPPPTNLNGLERRGADADDEDTEEEDDDMQDESPSASGGGSPPSELPNGRLKFLRDSRIEIAGGRELYSQSKSKAGRAKRFSDPDTLVAAATAIGTVQASLACGSAGGGRGVWEVRGKGKRQAHALQPPVEMVTETVFSTEVRSIRRVSDASRFRAAQQQPPPPPVVYEASAASLGAAEVVVFDDIGECLADQHLGRPQPPVRTHHHHHEEDSSAGSSSPGRDTPPAYHRPPADFFKVCI